MTRYEILLKKPVPVQEEVLKSYYMGMDVALGVHEHQDENAIAITHLEEDTIIVDFIDRGHVYSMDKVVEWASELSKKWSIREGIVDEIHMARVLGLMYVPTINSEMSYIFNHYKNNIIAGDGFFYDSSEWKKNSNLRDALVRSVWLSIKNELAGFRKVLIGENHVLGKRATEWTT
jgi:hypothetical protein